MTRDEAIDVLADEIRHRRDGCVLLLAVSISSGANAMDMDQDDIDEAFWRAEVNCAELWRRISSP